MTIRLHGGGLHDAIYCGDPALLHAVEEAPAEAGKKGWLSEPASTDRRGA